MEDGEGLQEHNMMSYRVGAGENELESSMVLSRKEATKELMGRVVNSEEEAYKLYCDYAYRIGFSIRKGKQRFYVGTKNLRTKEFYCSKEGLKSDEPVTEANFNRPDTRTNCKAMVRFGVDHKGQWRVVQFVPEHNHQLARPGERHMLRSARYLAAGKVGVKDPSSIILVAESRLPIELSPPIEEVDASQNAGYTIRECYDQFNTQSMTTIEAGDCQCLISYFKRRSNEEGMFYWDVQVDQESRMTNFFWRDGRSRNDYDCFGDVVLLDTSFRTNRYSLICALFVGINHHLQNVVFGCAFLLDTSVTSYVWLFKSFLDAMGGQAPKTILTDQDDALAEALVQVFPDGGTRHCFSHWHVLRSVQTHLSGLNTNQGFHASLSKCLQGCETEEDFEENWNMLLHEYKLQENSWIRELYRYRDKWCFAFTKDAFTGGINLPFQQQQAEGSSYLFSGMVDESSSLTKFALSFEKLVKSFRKNESEEDFRCSQTTAVRAVKHSPVLKHAAEIYSHKIYKLFEAEFLDGCGAASCAESALSEGSDTFHNFDIMMQGRGPKIWTVVLDTARMEVSCCCKKFESMGILCSHALRALSMKNIEMIPEKYVLRRWTKDARSRMVQPQLTVRKEPSQHQDCMEEAEVIYSNRAMQYAQNLVAKSRGFEESRKIFWDTLESGEKALEVFFEMRSFSTPHSSSKNKESKRKKKSESLKQVEPSPSGNTMFPFHSMPGLPNSATPSMARPFYYQGYPSAGMPANQIYIHPNMHPMPLCAPTQDLSAYGTIRPTS